MAGEYRVVFLLWFAQLLNLNPRTNRKCTLKKKNIKGQNFNPALFPGWFNAVHNVLSVQ